MSKVIYARVPDDIHAYITRLADEGCMPMAKVIEALVRGAQDRDWRILPAKVTAGPENAQVHTYRGNGERE